MKNKTMKNKTMKNKTKRTINLHAIVKNHINMSLKTKMRALMFLAIIPLSVFVMFLIFRLGTYLDDYDAIYNNISIANEFSQNFKNNYDYSMYQIVIGSSDFKKEKISEQLEQASQEMKKLRDSAFMFENKSNTKKMFGYLDSLKRSTEIIQNNLTLDEPKYDKNLRILDNDIRTTTTLITDAVQKYVYYETFQMDKVHYKIESETSRAVKLACIIFAVLLITTLALIEIISYSITKPIKNLCVSAKLVGNGDFTTRVPDSDSDEIATLTTSFNSMIGKIGSLVEDVKLEQINLRKTELKLMQAQINPHFLYNTLDTIVWLAEDNKNKDVVKMVSALSKFFRVVLNKGHDFITIKDEEMLIRSYLQIQQYRYQDILEYEINISKELEYYKILNLSLQPIVENALYHGIKNKRGKGKIIVEGSYIDGMIVLRVKDNGIGMKEEQLDIVQRILTGGKANAANGLNGFGIANVNERIKLNFGSKYGLSVESTYGVGSEFTLCIPAITESSLAEHIEKNTGQTRDAIGSF